MAIHPFRAAHALSQLKAEVTHQLRHTGIVYDARQGSANALPGACTCTTLTAVPLGILYHICNILAIKRRKEVLHDLKPAPVLKARNLLIFCSPSGMALKFASGEADALCTADTSSALGSDQRSCTVSLALSVRCPGELSHPLFCAEALGQASRCAHASIAAAAQQLSLCNISARFMRKRC